MGGCISGSLCFVLLGNVKYSIFWKILSIFEWINVCRADYLFARLWNQKVQFRQSFTVVIQTLQGLTPLTTRWCSCPRPPKTRLLCAPTQNEAVVCARSERGCCLRPPKTRRLSAAPAQNEVRWFCTWCVLFFYPVYTCVSVVCTCVLRRSIFVVWIFFDVNWILQLWRSRSTATLTSPPQAVGTYNPISVSERSGYQSNAPYTSAREFHREFDSLWNGHGPSVGCRGVGLHILRLGTSYLEVWNFIFWYGIAHTIYQPRGRFAIICIGESFKRDETNYNGVRQLPRFYRQSYFL